MEPESDKEKAVETKKIVCWASPAVMTTADSWQR